MKTLAIALLSLLSGCATCERHPVMCGVATAIVVGSIAAAAENHGGSTNRAVAAHTGPCTHGRDCD